MFQKEQIYDSYPIRILANYLLSNLQKLNFTSLDDIRLLAYYFYEYKVMDKVGFKLSTMKDTNLHI